MDTINTPSVNRLQVINSAYLLSLFLINGKAERADVKAKILTKFSYNLENLPVTVPFCDYMQAVDFVRQEYYSDLNQDMAYELIGYNSSQHYLNSPLGQVLRLAASVLGPKRGLHQFVKTMRTVMPFGKHELVELSSHYTIYQMSDIDVPPALVCGWLKASLEITNAKIKQIRAEELGSLAVNYHLQWV